MLQANRMQRFSRPNSAQKLRGLAALLLLSWPAVAAPQLRLSTSAIGPVYIAPGQNGITQTVEAANIGDGVLSLSVLANVPWIEATVGAARPCAMGKACLPVNVVLSTRELMPGLHTGTITLTDPNARDAPQTLTVSVQLGEINPDAVQTPVSVSAPNVTTFSAPAVVNTFPDRATFNAGTSRNTVVSFERIAADGGFSGPYPSYSSSGITITPQVGEQIFIVGKNTDYAGNSVLGVLGSPRDLTITFPAGTTAVAFDYGDRGSNATYTFTAKLGDGSIAVPVSVMSAPTDKLDFFGINSTAGILSIEINSPDTGDSIDIDNVSFGQLVPTCTAPTIAIRIYNILGGEEQTQITNAVGKSTLANVSSGDTGFTDLTPFMVVGENKIAVRLAVLSTGAEGFSYQLEVGSKIVEQGNNQSEHDIFLSCSAAGGYLFPRSLQVLSNVDPQPSVIVESASGSPDSIFASAQALFPSDLFPVPQSWLSVSGGGVLPQSLRLNISPAGLQVGNYLGNLTVFLPTGAVKVPVNLTVPRFPTRPNINGYGFGFDTGTGAGRLALGVDPLPQQCSADPLPAVTMTCTLSVENISGNTASFQALSQTNDGGNWLPIISPASNVTLSTPSTVLVRLDPSTLSSGSHFGELILSRIDGQAGDELNVSFNVNSVPNVIGQGTDSATTTLQNANLLPGTVTTAPSSSVASGRVIQQTPSAGTSVSLFSLVNLVVSTGPGQVTVPNVVGQTKAAATNAITSAGLVVGNVTNAASSTVPSGNVISQNPVGGTSVAPNSAVDLVISAGVTPLLVTVPNVVGKTQADATTAITNAGFVLGTVSTAASSTVPAGSVISQSPTGGSTAAPNSAVNITVAVSSPNPNAPVLSPGGTVNNSNVVAGAPLAPGTIASVYGNRMATSSSGSPGPPLLTQYQGTSIQMGSISAPLFSISPTLVNVQIPFELTPNQSYSVVATLNGLSSAPDTFTVAPATPAVLAFGDNSAKAQHNDGSYVNAGNPAKPGETLSIYLVGMGKTTPAVASGAAAPSNPLALVNNAPTVTIDGTALTTIQQVPFAGLVPGSVGLYQVKFTVPTNARTGTLNLAVTQNGFLSNVTQLIVHP